ncbi:MAG TPA: VCBS repeat-containing protein, partial [Candidatus Sulfotelmatobacter sp.]|nr:VCBS repeat-containing protein [Candidatus Sulfotelmatobacter sp.]
MRIGGTVIAALCISLLAAQAQQPSATMPGAAQIRLNQRFSRLAGTLGSRPMVQRNSALAHAQASASGAGHAQTSVSGGGGLFQVAPQFHSGLGGVATGDLNADGKADVVALTEETVRVYLSNGAGSFAQPVEYAVPFEPGTALIADFNGDGKLDLVVVSIGASSAFTITPYSLVSILLGNGDGTFQPRADFAVPFQAGATALGDFNGDGKLDVAIAGPTLSILLGNGDGTFQPHLDTAMNGVTGSLVIGDFNGDGKADVAIATLQGVGILIGKGDGTFASEVDYVAGINDSLTLAAGDFNGDHHLDLAFQSSAGSHTVNVLLGNADGTFQPAILNTVDASQPYGIYRLVAADFNGDGKADIAGVVLDENLVVVSFGNGDGTLRPAVDYGVGQGDSAIALADLDGNGKTDLVVANTTESTFSALLNNGDGTFRSNLEYLAGVGPSAAVTADFNGDGMADVAVANGACIMQDNDCQPSQSVSVLLGKGDGTFRAHVDYPVGNYPQAVAVGDFNGDGHIDIVTPNHDDDTVSVLLGNGDGTFRARTDYATAPLPYWTAVGDFNGDGKLDLAVATAGSSVISVLLGNGDGTFRTHVEYATALPSVAVAAADLNGDGKLDLVVVAPNDSFGAAPGQVSILLGHGDGTFPQHVEYSVGRAWGVAVADLNGDNKPDLVTANGGLNCRVIDNCSNDATISVLLGNGDGTFQAARAYPTGAGPYSVSVADFNHDGAADIVTANVAVHADSIASGTTFSMLWGNGDGTFRPHLEVEAGPGPISVAVADFNGDSKPDLAVALAASSRVSALLNTQTALQNVLTVNLTSGNSDFGVGLIVSNPPDFSCGPNVNSCSAAYDPNSAIDLNSGADNPALVFSNWTGDCTGSSACALDMRLDRTVTAVFAPNPSTFTLAVTKTGTGGGTLGAAQNLLVCSGDLCSGSYPSGTTVSVGAVADTGSTFSGWSNPDCPHTQLECVVTMNSDIAFTGAFDITPDFRVSASDLSPGAISPGQSATSAIAIAAVAGFSSAVALTCSVSPNPPLTPQCSINPNSAIPGTPATLTVTTAGPQAGLAATSDSGLGTALSIPLSA